MHLQLQAKKKKKSEIINNDQQKWPEDSFWDVLVLPYSIKPWISIEGAPETFQPSQIFK